LSRCRSAPEQRPYAERHLSNSLRREGFLPSAGAYFLNIDLPASGVTEPDRDFCLRAVKEAGVAAIPVSAFYEEDKVTSIARLCFSKADATLDDGVRRLAKAREFSVAIDVLFLFLICRRRHEKLNSRRSWLRTFRGSRRGFPHTLEQDAADEARQKVRQCQTATDLKSLAGR